MWRKSTRYSNGALAGTQYPLFRPRQWITQADEAGMSWGVLFVDIRHAFDAVNFNTLAAQLARVLPSAELEWVQRQVAAWYCGAWLQVGKGGTDPTFKVELGRGVLRGSVLSPVLWNIYVNQVAIQLEDCKPLLAPTSS